MGWGAENIQYFLDNKEFVRSKTIDGGSFNRVVLFGREAARKYKFNDKMNVAEDLLFYLQVERDEAFNIHEISASEEDFLYMYDFCNDGAVMSSMKDGTMVSNVKMMMDDYENGR